MRQRPKASSKLAKARSRKTVTRKRLNAPKVHGRGSPARGKETEIARVIRELKGAREQQTATADVLKVISRSTFDLQIVLNTLVESAAQLCDADMATMHRQDGTNYRAIATYGGPPAHREARLSIPFEAGRGSIIGRTVIERKPIQVADVLADPEYSSKKCNKKSGIALFSVCRSCAKVIRSALSS